MDNMPPSMAALNKLEVVMNRKKTFLVILTLVFVGIFGSCASVQYKMLPPQAMEFAEIIGRVDKNFISYHPLHIFSKRAIARRSYENLLKEARQKYGENVDVVNITTKGRWHPVSLSQIFSTLGNFQKVRASGDVIRVSKDVIPTSEVNLPKEYNYSLFGSLNNTALAVKDYETLGIIFVRSTEIIDNRTNNRSGSKITSEMLMLEAKKLNADDVINVRIDVNQTNKYFLDGSTQTIYNYTATALAIKYRGAVSVENNFNNFYDIGGNIK